MFTTEGEVALVAPNNLLWVHLVHGGQTRETSRLGVLTRTEGGSGLGDDELGGEDVPGGHHVPSQTWTILYPVWETRVLVHVFAVAVVRADKYILTFVTFTTGHTSTQKTVSRHFFHHSF